MAAESLTMLATDPNEVPMLDNIAVSKLNAGEDETTKLENIPGYGVNADFIRASLGEVDANSLRLALYQTTNDKELAAMQVTKADYLGGAVIDYVLSKEDQEIVRAKALEYLLQGPHEWPAPPSEEETCRLMDLFSDVPMKSNPELSFDYKEGVEELAFEDFPRDVQWTKDIPSDLSKWKVVIVGAGISGIAAAIPLKRLGIPFEIIERQGGIGGTWLRNSYPNVRVDSPSCLYQYKFTKNYKWREHFPPGKRVQEYLVWVANEYGLIEHIKFDREVVGAEWDEETKSWNMTINHKQGSQVTQELLQPNFIISGSGLFNAAKLPDIPGISSYKGPIFHTSQWDHGIDYNGKNIGLIGTGSTGTQLAPALAPGAKNLTVYQRTANWIVPFEFFNSKISDNTNWLYEHMPFYKNWYMFGSFFKSLNFFSIQGLDKDWRAKGGMISERNDSVREALTKYINECLSGRPDLVSKMLPAFAPMTRRMVVDNGFYNTIQRDNVDLITDGIECITETGIRTKDGERQHDMIVLGAGFKVSQYFFPVEYKGTEGMTLKKLWEKDGARSYLGLVMPNYPNLFTSYGPNHQPRAGSLHSFAEQWGRYAALSIVHVIENGAKSMEVKREIFDDYNHKLDLATKELIWEGEGSGYFVNEHGRQGVNMPWTTAEYHRMIFKPDFDDFIIKC
ncbi:hypothetical protein BP6252_13829 [Coleophoma cylindrospora]|uniref:4-hydroxyacetophenone monooxygenase n=1 Tax=Coleophoma cylindrospora TaxID=1849047 RepID=A0A3D8Q5T4_9HELO|nr:hypothetical protein BP6252_13829 [Coleophoma cylindrospora]